MSSTLDVSATPFDLSARRRFLALIAYFVGVTYLIPSSALVERFSVAYFALVVPAWIYVLLNWKWLFKAYTPASLCLVTFCGGAMIAALAQGNLSLAYNALFLASISIVILNSRVYITSRELNFLFLLCLAGSVAIYWGGVTDYGFLPGQALSPACHQAMNFRVSLFRVLTESAVLSLFVVVTNVFFAQGGGPLPRLLISVLALYFLLFSGIRTMALAFLAVLPFLLYQGWKKCQLARHRVVALAALVSLGLAGTLFLVEQDRGSDVLRFLQNYVFRTATCDAIVFETENDEYAAEGNESSGGVSTVAAASKYMFGVSKKWLRQTINRSCNVSYHLHLISQSPWIGNRSTVPTSEAELIAVGCQRAALTRYCEACTLPTYWLSKAGVTALPLLLCFLVMLATVALRRELFGVTCLVAFGVISIGWGVSFVPYNFTLLLMMSVPAMSRYQSQARGA